MSDKKLNKIHDVDIDARGKFKYILIKLEDPETKEDKYVVRGYKDCPYHADIFDKVEPTFNKHKLKSTCTGGGRILHDPDAGSILVYGYSQAYGKADHSISVDLLKKHYPNYHDISFSNEGY